MDTCTHHAPCSRRFTPEPPQYVVGDAVRLWVNKVGPYNNPQETYNYYYLPFCKPRPGERIPQKWGGLGEVLEGNQLVDSQLEIKYRCACV